MRKVILFFALILACTPASLAQSSDDYNRWEFFGGYSHARVDTGLSDSDPDFDDIVDEREGFHGFNTSGTGNITRYVGLKFDFSGHFKDQSFPVGASSVNVDSSLFNILGGVQLKDNSKEIRFKPFAHALAGVARGRNKVSVTNPADFCATVFPSPCPIDFTASDTGFAAAIGGGIDYRLSDRLDVRAIQFDYNPTRLFDGTQHNFRIGVGIVIH